MKKILLAAVLLVLTALLLFSFHAESKWPELRSVAELRERFNADEGSLRIVLLLSPT